MVQLPTDMRLETEKLIEDEIFNQDFREYLGISSIGAKCARSLWYSFRMCSKNRISARLHRLFQRGHREEAIIQADLRKIGIHHHSDQKEVVAGFGHIKGHIDDILEGVPDAPKTPHLGEYKTHNDKSFKDMKQKGLRLSKPVHYAQMVCYMRLLDLKRGLYIAVNKNDDSRYYERINEDEEKADHYLERGIEIITSLSPMDKIGNSTWYECKWCDFYHICHTGSSPLMNCRTCRYSSLEDEGKWSCKGYKIELAFEQQKLGCSNHKFLESFES